MEKLIIRVLHSRALRLILSGVIVSLPITLSNAWLRAGYHQVIWDEGFTRTFLVVLVFSFPAIFISGFCLLYPLERWAIRDRAARSWKWVAVRLAFYVAAGFPIGLVSQLAKRLGGMPLYPAVVESSSYVTPVANIAMVGLLYSFLEWASTVMEKREARLQRQIRQLRIEIDEVKRARKVQEITESDYFRTLQSKTRQMRGE